MIRAGLAAWAELSLYYFQAATRPDGGPCHSNLTIHHHSTLALSQPAYDILNRHRLPLDTMRRWFVVVLLLILPLQAYSSHYHATVQGGQSALFAQHESDAAESVERRVSSAHHPLHQLSAILAHTPMQQYADHADTPLPCPVQSFWLHAWPSACPTYSLPAICCEFAPEHRPPRV